MKKRKRPDNPDPEQTTPTKRRMTPVKEFTPTKQMLAKESGLEWIVSHVRPDKVIWSSNPDIIKPDINIEGRSR